MQIRTRVSFYVYLLLIALLSSFQTVLAALCALAVHEMGHMIIAYAIKEPIIRVELTPFGGIMHYKQGRCGQKGVRGIAVAAAGPAANYLFLMLLGTMHIQNALGDALTEKLIIANASMLLVNLLPALPLDGGRAVLSAGFYFFKVSALIRALCMLGCVVGAGLTVLSLVGLGMYGVLNCSLIVIGVYLIGCAWMSKETLMYENTYAVIKERQEQMRRIQSVRVWVVDANTKLHELIPAICRSQEAAFILRNRPGNSLISENDILHGLLTQPSMTIEEAACVHRNTNLEEN